MIDNRASFAFGLLLVASVAGVAQARDVVDVDTCGQFVPDRSRARLVRDLDCTGETSPTFSAVTLGRGARLSLDGHTVAGGNRAILCDSSCRVEGPGTIERAEYGLSAL